MSNSVGDLVLSISTDIASLNTGLNAAAGQLSTFTNQATKQLEGLAGRLDSFASAFKAIGEISIAGFGVHAFADMIESTIQAQAKLVDLATIAGSTAAEISSLAPAAKLSGTSFDAVTDASAKFSKNLIDVQTGTGKAADAFKALGFNAQDAARFLDNPSQGLLELGQRLNTFADSGSKTAAVMALLGRSGQDLLPFLKQLGEQGQLNATVSDQQAEAAHRLEDQWHTLQLRGDELKNSIASGVTPALSDVVKAFTDATSGPDSLAAKIKELAADGSLAIWATKSALALAVIGESVGAVIASIAALHTDVDLLVADLQLIVAAANAPKLKPFGSLGFSPEEAKAANDAFDAALQARNAALANNEKTWEDLWNKDRTTLSTALRAQLDTLNAYQKTFAASLAAIRALPQNADARDIQLFGAAAEAPGKKPTVPTLNSGTVDQFTAALQELTRQAANANQEIEEAFSGDKLTAADKFLNSLQSNAKAWASISAADKETIVGLTEFDSQLEKVAAELQASANSIVEYAKANAALQTTVSANVARQQTQALSQQIDDAKRQYDRGLLDFENYYQQVTAAQKASLGVQVEQLRQALGAQQDALNASLQKNVDDANKVADQLAGGYITWEQAQKVLQQSSIGVVQAQTDVEKAQGALNDALQKGATIGKDYVERLIGANSAIAASNKALEDQIRQQQLANDTIGLTASQIQLVTAARAQDLVQQAIAHGADQKDIETLEKQITLHQQLSDALAKGEALQHTLDNVRAFNDEFESIFNSIFDKSDDTLKRIGDDLKKYVLDLLYQLTVKPFVIQIAASLTGLNAANIAGSLSGTSGNPLSLLFGNNATGGTGPLSFLSPTNLANSFSYSSVGQFLGLSTAGSGILASGAAEEAAASIPAALGPQLTAAGSFFAAAAPYIPLVSLALPLLSGLFNKPPSEAKGQFQITTGTSGFEDNAFVTSVLDGLHLGFADANTQQFSGDAAKAFDQIVAGAIDAFSQRYSPDQRDRLASVLQQTTFPTFEGTYTTQDFINKYGGQVLQSVVQAAFQVLDPALASVEAGFSGTADEVATFSNTLLAIYDATKALGNADFTSAIDQALQGATQAAASDVLAFVQVVQTFGQTIQGLGTALEGIDPNQIGALVEAFGGAQQFAQTFSTFNADFGTAADKTNAATEALAKTFGDLGIAVPTTHADFIKIVDDFLAMGNTDAAQQVLAVSDAFVTLHGTAEAAAQALAQAAQQGLSYFNQHFLTPQEQLAQRQAIDETALAQATAAGTALNAALTDLGYKVIPTTVDEVKQLVAAVLAKYGADSQEYQQLLAIIPTLGDLIDSVGGFANAAQSAANAVSQAASSITTSVGSIIQAQNALAQAGKDAADKVLSSITDLANQGTGDFGDKLGTQINLITSALASAGAVLTGGGTTVTHQRGQPDIVTVAPLVYSVPGGDAKAQSYVQELAAALTKDTDELSRFTVLSAQYGASIAEQLVALQDWYAQEQQIFAGNSAALDAAHTNFEQKWQAIVAGIQNGVTGTTDQLDKLKQGIASYLEGLQIGNLSPLLPLDQLNAAHDAYVNELLKAQGGDQGALGDITQFADAYLKEARDFYASSHNYTDIFNGVTQQLGDLAGTLPSGLPLAAGPNSAAVTAVTAIEAALPPGTIASSADVATLNQNVTGMRRDMVDLMGALAAANAEDIKTQTTTLVSATMRRQMVPLK